MSARQLLTKWYGIHKLQESMGRLQTELARLSSDPHDSRVSGTLVHRVELKLADVMCALQWFEYHNQLDIDPDRSERIFERFDAWHLKPVMGIPGQTHMHGVVAESIEPPIEPSLEPEPELVISLSRERSDCPPTEPFEPSDSEPETLPGSDSTPISSPPSAEVSHGSREG